MTKMYKRRVVGLYTAAGDGGPWDLLIQADMVGRMGQIPVEVWGG